MADFAASEFAVNIFTLIVGGGAGDHRNFKTAA
jgi:hypothetical protein